MAKSVSGIEAAILEARGLGELSVVGKSVRFHQNGRHVSTFWFPTPSSAQQGLRIFRAAPKYMVAA